MNRISTPIIVMGAIVALPTAALAHGGMDGGAHHGLFAGALHPLFGLDHVLAMLAVGAWAVQLGGRALWAIPLMFVTCMLMGGLLPIGAVQVPILESIVLASVFVLGLALMCAWRAPVAVVAVLVGMFAICHGIVHVVEKPVDVSGGGYILGFMITTVMLHLAGMTIGLLHEGGRLRLSRCAGGVVVACALLLAANVL